MEIEVFDIIKAVNRLSDKVIQISTQMDAILKSIPSRDTEKYCDKSDACKILKVSERTLAKMCKNNEIPWIKQHRKIMYPVDGLYGFLEKNCKH